MSVRYWDERALRFASAGKGLAAVCSYGMPGFYNGYIDHCQRLALTPWLQVENGSRVLDVGCGVGRWSLEFAARGANVDGIDLSPAMIEEAERRAVVAGHSTRCRYEACDLTALNLNRTYSLILGVTVLQHILEAEALERAVASLSRHLAPGGRLVLLEAAPSRRNKRCDTRVFRARTLDEYLMLFARHGLRPVAITGVDPMPLKTMVLPYYRRLPRWLALPLLAGVTLCSWPVDGLFGRLWTGRSWHKVMVLEHAPPPKSA